MKRNTLIMTCLCGTALEWFDFSLFGVLSPTLIRIFFLSGDKLTSFSQAFTLFAVGFLIRPFAAFFWGYWGDKIGRKKIILWAISLMTLSSVGIGILPPYSSVGVISGLLLIMLRLLQAFSASGEHAGMLTYLYEISPKRRRPFFSSIGISGVFLGMAMATFLGAILQALLNQESFLLWGWRIPFLSSAILGLIGYALRRKLIESKTFIDYLFAKKVLNKSQWRNLLIKHQQRLIQGIFIFQLAVVSPYVIFVYLIPYQIKINHDSANFIYFVTFLNLLSTSVFVMLFGFLKERIKMWSQTLSVCALMFGSLILFFTFNSKNLLFLFLLQFYFGFFTGMLVGPFCSSLAESFFTGIRYTGVSICLNLSVVFFALFSIFVFKFVEYFDSPKIFLSGFILISSIVALMPKFLISYRSYIFWGKSYLK